MTIGAAEEGAFRGACATGSRFYQRPSPLSRRTLLAAAAAVSLRGGTGSRALAQPSAKIPIVDVHHHMAPPAFLAALAERNMDEPVLKAWTPEKSLADMDRAGVATAVLSMTEPGVWFGDDQAAVSLARSCNEYGAKLVSDHPGRFGLFAALPLPDVDGSLREIEYALDHLKADGIGLMTSYGNQWLGDSAFTPVMDELNQRKAVVFTHPVLPSCCRNLIAEVPRAVVEFGTDTTRTIASIVFTGTASRCPDIGFIFSHGGGTMPYLIERFVKLGNSKQGKAKVPEGVLPVLRRFYYDTAQVPNTAPLAALTAVVPMSQILFGTDFPFRPSQDYVTDLEKLLSAPDLHKVESDNARALLPRLRAA